MGPAPTISTPNVAVHPLDVLAAWPADRPVMMLHSGRLHPRWARWSIIAPPVAWFRFAGGRSTMWGEFRPHVNLHHDPLRDLDAVLQSTRALHDNARQGTGPFHGGWIGCLSYELGRWIEPRAQAKRDAKARTPWPTIELAHCPRALVLDHVERTWRLAGHDGDEAAARDELPAILARAAASAPGRGHHPGDTRYRLGEWESNLTRDEYRRAVDRTLAYIAAGDMYQANIAQRLSCEFEGSPRALAIDALRRAQPWYGAYLESAEAPTCQDANTERPGRRMAIRCSAPSTEPCALISLSPELFLDVDPATRRVTTRPIKGTRPASSPPRELIESAKDAAELHMIVDLMRNDLGRVCEYGSVQVVEPRMIETHPTVHQGVAEITGRLRADVSPGDLLGATFPGGSVTGAPKIRAMQIIDELEPGERGPYCGAIGSFSDCGRTTLSIAIRTMMVRGESVRDGEDAAGSSAPRPLMRGTLEYGVGGGIVAESAPEQEYDECLVKSRVVMGLTRAARPPAAATLGP